MDDTAVAAEGEGIADADADLRHVALAVGVGADVALQRHGQIRAQADLPAASVGIAADGVVAPHEQVLVFAQRGGRAQHAAHGFELLPKLGGLLRIVGRCDADDLQRAVLSRAEAVVPHDFIRLAAASRAQCAHALPAVEFGKFVHGNSPTFQMESNLRH